MCINQNLEIGHVFFHRDEELPWWPCGFRRCHWLLAVCHHCLGSNPDHGMWESYKWLLGVMQWLSPGTLGSTTRYKRRVTTWPQFHLDVKCDKPRGDWGNRSTRGKPLTYPKSLATYVVNLIFKALTFFYLYSRDWQLISSTYSADI